MMLRIVGSMHANGLTRTGEHCNGMLPRFAASGRPAHALGTMLAGRLNWRYDQERAMKLAMGAMDDESEMRLGPRRRLLIVGAALVVAQTAARGAGKPPANVHLEELTWTELRDRIAAGATTVLVPIGGTEQNGPHMVLGKHNVRARAMAERIAQGLGDAMVAPVMAYVPEGSIDPPAAHMRYTGTVSISDAVFEAVLESAARSFRQHGFREVIFLGDHGGYQKNMEHVAARLNREWAARPACRVHALGEYYRAVLTEYVQALKERGFAVEEIGTHAGLADTALALAIDPGLVRADVMAARLPAGAHDGVSGDPRRATAELGQLGIQLIVEASVKAIRARTQTTTKRKP